MNQATGNDDYAVMAIFYDHLAPYRDRRDVAFFVEIAQHTPGPVLELGCGTGRVLIPTARAGKEIVGLDASEAMLAVCREKLSSEPDDVQVRVHLVSGDMRRFEVGRAFGLATIPFRPFQHVMTVDDQLSCLASIHRHLIDGGRLVFDVYNPYLSRLIDDRYLVESDDIPEFTMPDGRRVTRRHRTVSRDLFNQVNEEELIYYVTHPDGREERFAYRFQMRYLFRFELEHLLVRSGFQVEAIYADYDKSPYGSKYPGELICVARKG
ncbi:MAG: class I SAM-dependent methyltransferase [Candidatus Latescibacteria bacterium]|nr:class I SAM-dependent methyltransferase [Candidatus Latescibacterota bacterium]